jgi:hypothetical protein
MAEHLDRRAALCFDGRFAGGAVRKNGHEGALDP